MKKDYNAPQTVVEQMHSIMSLCVVSAMNIDVNDSELNDTKIF